MANTATTTVRVSPETKSAAESVLPMAQVLAACGNDCSACPRFVAHPYEKSPEQLRRTAELWARIGYRDHVVSNDEIACMGCKPGNWCRYRVVQCCADRSIATCVACPSYPCENMRECFEVTRSFEPACRSACSDEEYKQLQRAFFQKESNLAKAQALRG